MNAFLPKKSHSFFAFKTAFLVGFTAFLLPGKLFAQAPTISYSSPQSYQVGTAISALSPTSFGVAAWGYSSTANAIGSGLTEPVDVAADAAGNVYVADVLTGNIVKIPAGNGTPAVLAAFTSPFGIAVDAAGNVYVAAASAGAILEIPAGGGATNAIGSGFSAPSAVAVDASGNVYVADAGNGALKEVPAGNGTPVTLQSGFANIQGVAVDGSGNIYVADGGVGTTGNGAVYKIPEGGGSMSAIGTGFSRPSGVVVDAAGNLYVSDINNSAITVIETNGTQFTIGSGFNQPNGVALDGSGNLYIADSGNGTVKEVNITGGYFLSPFLPAGLTFNNNTGFISGTPTAAAAAANYTVTAYNVTGPAQAAINITVGAPVIGYNSPVAYPTGLAITPLLPTSTGGAVAGLDFSKATALSTGFGDATCLAWSKDGSIYIGESSGKVSVLAPGGSVATVFASGFGPVAGIAIDALGNVYVADGSSSIRKIPAGGGTPVSLGSFSGPAGVALDAAGNIYVADESGHGVYKMAADGTGQTKITDGSVSSPGSVAVDANGNVFGVDEGLSQTFEITAGGSEKTINGGNSPVSVTTDASGNVYVGSASSRGLLFLVPTQGVSDQIGPAFFGIVTAVMVDPNFNLYVVDGGVISKMSPNGGCFISPELPAGLTVNPNSGAISGTPAAASADANYTVTAFNALGSGTATVNIATGPPPVISYSTPPSYVVGTAISALAPSSTGAVVGSPFFNTTTTTLSTGLSDATCMAMDKAGNMYIGETSGQVSVLAPGSSSAAVFATGFGSVAGLAVDASGNVYVADGSSSIHKIPAGGGTAVALGSFSHANSMAVDAAGNIYVADNGSPGGIYKMAAGGTAQVKIYNAASSALKMDLNGNIVFFPGGGTSEIPAGGAVENFNSFNNPTAITFDPSGNVYETNQQGGTDIWMFAAGENNTSFYLIGLTGAVTDLLVDPSFNFYAAVNGTIIKMNAAGGYFISPELPPGLLMDPTNGAISGTPSAASPAANYTVTAFSAFVSGTTTVNITVNAVPPVISYSTPQMYTRGAAITPLLPASTGGAAGAPGFNTAPFNTGLFDASTLARDQAGDIYIGETSGQVSVLAAGGTGTTVFATGFSGTNGVKGIAVDASGDVYVVDGVSVSKIPAGGGAAVVIGSFTNPVGVALDAAGNVYVADASQGVYKMAADGTGQTQIDSQAAEGIAVDQNGNVFFSASGSAGNLDEIPAGGVQTTFHSFGRQITAVTTDLSGNIYVTESGRTLVCVPANGVAPFSAASFSTLTGIITDPNFNVYAAGGSIFKINPTGGFYTSSELPNGLTIDPTSGAISGTPTATSAAANYTVTAFNASGPGTTAVNIAVNIPLPAISYSTPQTYTTGTAITPLTPASTGGAVAAPGFNTTTTTHATGLGSPLGIAMDKAGNIYTSDHSSGEVLELAPGASAPIVFATGLRNIAGLAVDASGNVYAADGVDGFIWKIPAGGGTAVTLESGILTACLALDATGNIYFTGNNATYKMAPDGTSLTKISTNGSSFISVDLNGNVFFGFATTIYEIPAGGTQKLFATVPISVVTLTIDVSGNLYFSTKQSQLYMIPAGGGTPVQFGPHSATDAILVDANFNFYWATTSGVLFKINATGGYFASPELPNGLNIDPTSGIISGTPSTASPVTNYTVTAFNATGSGTATVNITVNGPPPVISYGTSQTYTAGTAIAPLTPASSGSTVSAPAYNSALTAVSSGFGSPSGVAMDAAGNIYVADEFNNDIIKIPPGGGTPATITANLNDPMGIAVDKLGNIYVADSQNGVVKEISADLSTVTQVGTGFIEPVNVALDPSGNLFIGDDGSGSIYEIEKATGKQSVFIGFFFEDLGGLATDAAGNVYATDEGTGSLYKFTARSNLEEQFLSIFNFPTAVAVDASGNIFVSEGNGAQVSEIAGGNNAPIAIGSGFSFPEGIVTDGAGNVYAADAGTEALYKITPSGGYYISQALPRGLKLNDTTGIISGTPKVVSAATDYTITAYSGGTPGSAIVNITVNAAPVPLISYGGAQTYLTGTAITPLSPTDSGGPVASVGYSDNLAVLGSGFSHPAATAVDPHGNVYVADNLNNLVKEIPAGGGNAVPIGGTGFSGPAAVAVDSTGNVYVADEGNAQIVEIPAAGGSNIILGSGFTAPNGVAVDPSGNVFVIDESTESVYEIPAGNAPVVTITSGFIQLTGIAVDASDNIYVADGGSSAVYKYPLKGGIPSSVGVFDYPTGVAVDAAGNLYVADQGPNVVYRVPAGSSGLFTVVSELNNPEGIAIDPYGNLYIADTDNNDVEEFSPDGGYFINRPLPSGLSMSSFTGLISGTPLAVSPATKYIVSAYNSGGVSQAAVNITVSLPPPPTVSYVTPQVFFQNTAIAPLSPTAANIALPAYGTTATPIGSGISFPYATAVDESGNVYIADPSAGSIYEILAGGPQITVGTGLNNPVGVAVDKFGNVYAADQGDNNVVEIQAHTGTQTFIGNGYLGVNAVAVDSAGNVYVADLRGSGGVVYRVPPGQNKHLFKSGFSDPNGIAVDASGNVYVSDGGSGSPSRVYEISPDGSTETHIHRFFNEATGVAIDATGNLFISDGGNSDIIEYPAGGGSSITITAGLTAPFNPSADGAGNLYVSDLAAGKVYKLTPAGGYFISRVLPAGLSLDVTAGIISGTPTALSPATNYTVTAYNSGGNAAAAVNIAVIKPSTEAYLANLTLQTASLSPSFAFNTLSYTANVAYSTSSVTVTPAVVDPNATITVNGTTVANRTASGPVMLSVGDNPITVVVTAQNGVATKTYTVTVTRAPSSEAYLANLTLQTASLSSSFAYNTLSYTASVAHSTSSVTVTPAVVDPNATVTVNGTTVDNRTASGPVMLSVGDNIITVVVTAQNGVTKQTYTVTITRAPSSEAYLANLTLQTAKLSSSFAYNTMSYTASVAYSTSSVTVTPAVVDPTAKVTVNGTTVANRTASGPVMLSVGDNPITVVVTAQNGVTKQTYTVTVTRAPTSDAHLTRLNISSGTLSPAFDYLATSYTASVNTATVTVTPTTSDANATVTINSATVASNTASGPINLDVGSNTITTIVTAEDGTSTDTYIITVTRVSSGDNSVYEPVSVVKPDQEVTLEDDGIMVHQAVSPNGDGINDFLQIDNIANYPDNHLMIMNRNGMLVYEAKGYDNSSRIFDGHSNKTGQMQLPGTYFYSLDYMVKGIAKHKTGFLVLKY